MSEALPRVFISYARADSIAFVDRLEGDLKAQQFHPWVDRHGLEGGQEWMEIIQDAIDASQALVVVMSPAAVQSQFVRMEYRYAASQSKLVIPAKYLSATRTPIDLHILQWVDFEAGYDVGLRQLMQALGRLKPPVVSPAPKARPQPTPVSPAPSKTKEQWRDEGIEHGNAGRYMEALVTFDQAIQLDPQFAIAHFNRGSALYGLKRYDEALPAFDQASQLDPQFSEAYYSKGATLWMLKFYNEALEAYDQAIKLDPQLAFAPNCRGNVFHDLQRYPEALVCYDQAIKLDPHNGMFYQGPRKTPCLSTGDKSGLAAVDKNTCSRIYSVHGHAT